MLDKIMKSTKVKAMYWALIGLGLFNEFYIWIKP